MKNNRKNYIYYNYMKMINKSKIKKQTITDSKLAKKYTDNLYGADCITVIDNVKDNSNCMMNKNDILILKKINIKLTSNKN